MEISNKTLGVFVAVSLLISMIGVLNLQSSITGFASNLQTGQVRINITPSASLNVTKALIDFGNGTVTGGGTNCTLSSLLVGDPRGCFTPSFGNDGPQQGPFQIRNVGSVKINVTLAATRNGSRSKSTPKGNSFWGVAYGFYTYKCLGNGTKLTTTHKDILNKSGQVCIALVNATGGQDSFRVDINLTIPRTATGLKNDTLTFTAIQACATTC